MFKINVEHLTNGVLKIAGIAASLAVAGAITLFSAALMKASINALFSKTIDAKVDVKSKNKKKSSKKEEVAKNNKAE